MCCSPLTINGMYSKEMCTRPVELNVSLVQSSVNLAVVAEYWLLLGPCWPLHTISGYIELKQ